MLTDLIREQRTDGVDLAWSWHREVKSMGSEGFVPGLFNFLALPPRRARNETLGVLKNHKQNMQNKQNMEKSTTHTGITMESK